jgi:hypothetical protein
MTVLGSTEVLDAKGKDMPLHWASRRGTPSSARPACGTSASGASWRELYLQAIESADFIIAVPRDNVCEFIFNPGSQREHLAAGREVG